MSLPPTPSQEASFLSGLNGCSLLRARKEPGRTQSGVGEGVWDLEPDTLGFNPEATTHWLCLWESDVTSLGLFNLFSINGADLSRKSVRLPKL